MQPHLVADSTRKEVSMVEQDPVRTAVRFPLRLELRIQTPQGEIEAVTVDVSASGLLFVTDRLPEIDSRVEFTMAMPSAVMGSTRDVSVHCVGRVVRHQQSGAEKLAAAVIDEYFLRA